jgi:O-antigen/teichoic acid export membrane protein
VIERRFHTITRALANVQLASPRTLPPRFVRNATSNYVNSLAALLLALFVTPVLVRGLGAEAYGIWTLVSSSVLYYSVLQFGLGRAAVKFVAEARAADDQPAARRVISTAFLTLAGPAVVLALASPALALLFTVLFDVPDAYRDAAMVLVVLSTVDFAIGMPSDTFGAGIVGLQRFDLLNATTTGTAVAQAGAWMVIIALGGGLVALGIATVTFSVLSNVVRYAIVRRLLGGVRIAPSTFDRSLVKPMVRMSSWIALSDFVAILTARLDPVIVGLVVGVPQAGIYAVGQKLAAFVERLSGPALSMFFPHAAALSTSGDQEALRRVLTAGTRLAFGLTVPLALIVSILAGPAVSVWVGSGFDQAAMVAVYLSLTMLIVSVTRVGVDILRGLGDVSFPARVGVLEALVSMGASIALGSTMGLEGVALGTLIGISANHLLLLVPYICRQLGVHVGSFAYRVVTPQLLPVGLAGGVGLAVRPFAEHGFLELLAAGALMFVVYSSAFAAVGLSAEERGHGRAFITRMLRRR